MGVSEKIGARGSSRVRRRGSPKRCYTARGLKKHRRGGGGGWFLSLRVAQQGDSLAGGGDGRKRRRPRGKVRWVYGDGVGRGLLRRCRVTFASEGNVRLSPEVGSGPSAQIEGGGDVGGLREDGNVLG